MTSIFSFDGTSGSFQNLATSFNGTLDKGLLVIDNNEIKGSVRRTEIEQGLFLVHWSLDIIKDYVFINKCCHSSSKFYFLSYFFDTQFARISPNERNDLKCKYFHPCTMLYSNKLDMTYEYKGGRTISCLCMIFSEIWLKEQGQAEGSGIIKNVLVAQQEAAHVYTTSATEQILSTRLTKEFTENPSWLSLKAHSYNLLNTFFNYTLPAHSKSGKLKPYMELVIEVEKKIRAFLTDTLPSTDQLAREFYVSSSTLKRHFKQFYGKNIYEYYLEQKMHLAKDILEKGNSTVSDVAYAIGYENVSHFIAVFKKQFDISPNEVVKNKHK